MAMLQLDKVAQGKGYNMAKLQVASRLNMSIVSRYWHNKVRSVSLDILEDFAKVLGVQVTDLISDEPEVQGDDIKADIEELRKSNPKLANRLHQMMVDGLIAAPIQEED